METEHGTGDMNEKDKEIELTIKVVITPELKKLFSSMNTPMDVPVDAPIKQTESVVSKPVGSQKIMVLGHDLILEKTDQTKPLVDFVQKFAKLERASKDVLVFRMNRLNLWKAAEKHTADNIIDFLKDNAKSSPPDSLKRWIFRTMSQWDSLSIRSEDNYDYLMAADTKLMDRILSMREVKSHIFRRLEPTKARITSGHRGYVKQVLIEKGYPVKDVGRYETFESLSYDMKLEEVAQDPRYEAYQKEAVAEFLKYGSGTIILPGGSGKTVIAVMAAAELNAPTLVLATRSEICKQFYETFIEKTTINKWQVKLIDADTKNRTPAPITICTYQIASRLPALWKKQWGLVVKDECQHIPSRVWRKTARIQSTRRLGLTATPVREDKKEKQIFSLIGPPVFERSWIGMAEEGLIAKAKAYEILVDMPPSLQRRYNHSFDEREKYVMASVNPSKLSVIRKLLEKHKDDKVLILGYYVQGALELGKKLDIPVAYGGVPPKQRHELYNKFRDDKIDKMILTSVGEEGVDLPSANVLIETCGLWGSRMSIGQRFSRILRPKEEGAIFYELSSRGTSEQDFSNKRRQFLIGKGYEFEQLTI